MSQQNPTIIVGHLDSSALTKSIDDLVKEVAKKTSGMAEDFTQAIDKMKFAMKDFAVTQKVSVDLMKEAWRDMSKSFDAMVAAQSAATGGGKGSGKGKVYAPDTVGALEQEIALEKEKRREMQLGSDELRDQNRLLEQRQRTLKQQTTSLETNVAKAFQTRIGNVISLPSKTFADANEKLRRLRELLDDMKKRAFLFDESKINRVKNAIDSVETKIERMRKKWGQQGQQPNTLQQVLGMDENSFDAISKKMAALKKLSWSDPIEQKRIIDEYQRLRQEQNKLMASNAQMSRSNNYLAQSFGYIRNRIVYALTLGAMTNFVKQIYEVRGQYELLERSLGVLVNSFERGSQVFNELNQMAIESPFTLMELAGAAKQLTAYNFAANEVVDTTRRLADISAALGVPMERLTYNLGQIRAQTVLNARDARDFANAGLPIVKSLSDYYTELEGKIVSTGDVYDRMSKKMVSYNDVMAVLNKMTDEGGKFFEFQAKQAQTLRVQMANLTLAWNNMLNEMGRGNQGLLSLPVQGLKAMLQNWASLNRVLKNVVLSFGLLRVAQMAAIRYNWQLASSAGGAAKLMGFLGNAVNKLAASLGALFANPWTWISVGIFAFVDLIGQMRAAKQATEELNEEIRNGATEASQANLDFLNNKGNKATLELAKQNKLTAEQGEKAWQAIEQQISTSAMSANKLLGELWAIDDINERVRKGFEYTESIQKAQAALQDLQEDTITLTRDKGWFGVFGEGFVSDLKDLQEELGGISGGVGMFGEEGKLKDISAGFTEYREELEKTAESINNFIVAHKITDPLQINEILERVKAVIKTKNPEIKGELATLFDVTLDQRMMFLTNGAIDQNTSLWKMFLDRLKHNYSSTFQGITNDIYKENAKLSKEQQEAVDANLEYFKKTMPYYYDAIESMVSDASKLRINIGVTFGVQKLTDFQDQVNKRIANAPKVLDFGTEAMLPTQNDNLSSWVKTQQDAIAKLKEENKKYKKDDTEWSKEQIKNNDTEIQQRKNLLDLFKQSYEKDKKGGSGGSKKDPMLDTLKQTVDIVKKLQSEYDSLTKSGASSADALDDVRKRYSRTIAILNNDLQGFGLPQLNLEMIKGRNPNDVLEYFQKISDILTNKGLSTLERQKAVEVVIQELSLKAKTYNLDMITKGLNNELGKLKDEYELAVELDANPEMGNLFADWMGVDMSTLPHTAEEYAKRMTKALNKYLADEKSGIEIGSLLALTDDDLHMFQQRAESGELNQVWVDNIVKNTKEARNALKKENSDIAKDWDNLVQKYSEYEYKIAQVQRNVNKERKAFALKYGSNAQKERALVLTTEIDAEKDQAKKQELINQLKQLLDDIAGDDETKLKIKVAIDKKGLDESARVSFEEFQKSPDWIVATGDLAGMTDKAIGMLIESIEKYKVTAKNLSPKQIKQLNRALVELYKKQREGNPFKALSTAMMEAKNRVSVYEDELKETQDELDELTKKQAKSFSAERAKDIDAHIKKIKELKEKIEEGAELKATNIVEGLQGMVSTANAVSSAVGDMWEAFGGSKEVTEQINGVFTVLDSTLEKAQLGAQIGGKWGAIAGAVVGLFTGLGQVFGGGKDDITLAIERSERSVKQLEIAYKHLEVAIEEAYGAAKWGAEQAAIANKKLQLAELKRQLALERSRDSKDRDEGKINDLMGQIEDLKIEIEKSIKDITNDLLGISSVGNAAEELVSSMIDAFRKGEDYMLHYDQTFEDMINNMVMKSIVGRVIGDRLQSLWDRIDAVAKEKGEPYQKQIDALMEAKKKNEDSLDTISDKTLWAVGVNKAFFDKYGITLTDKLMQNNERIDEEIKKLQKQYSDAIAPTPEDVQSVRDDAANWRDSVKSEFEAYMELFGIKFGDSADGKQLSSLQQGIQSVTETTAGAIEAYMNSVNQQGYLRNDILVQIRDTIQSFDIDVQTASLGQILLQLQASYQVQMSIQGILEGWATPSGQAVRVELVS